MVTKDLKVAAFGPELAAVLTNDATPWYKQPHLLRLNFCLFSLFLFSSANGYDGSLMNGLQALTQWNAFMDYPTGAWLGFINAVPFLGAVVCYPVVAWTNNKIGRKKSVAIGYFWLVLGTSLQTASHNHASFVLGRLFTGGVSSFFGVSAAVLITETAHPMHRGVYTALANVGWWIGSFLAAWITYGTRNIASNWAWRIPSLLQFGIPALALYGYVMAPESPRWLVSKDRIEDARRFLVKYHAGGNDHSQLADFELQEISQTLHQEAEIAKKSTWLDMLGTKGHRHRTYITVTLGLFSQWNGIGIASYYLAPVLVTVGVTSVTNQTMIAGFLQLWNLIFSVIGALSVDRWGRRRLFLFSAFGMLVSFILISGLSGSFATTHHAGTGIAVIPFIFIFCSFFAIGITPLMFAYICEIWPYDFRARGFALGQMSASVGVFFNIFVNPIALQAIGWKYYIVYCVIIVLGILNIYFTYPETSGHTLEEMSRVFDGDEAAVPTEAEVHAAMDHGWAVQPEAKHPKEVECVENLA